MLFDPPLIPATLIRRYKRFLADVRMEDGNEITVHCPNPGAMTGLTDPGNKVWISDSGNPKRKLRHTLELMQVRDVLVGINTNRANSLAREAIEAGLVEGADPGATILHEQKYGANSRIDFLLRQDGRPDHYIEVKNVHLVRTPGLHEFPDSVTARGTKHLGELAGMAKQGHRATMLYLVQREDGDRFALASDIDPAYAEAFANARTAGVEARCIICSVTRNGISPVRAIDFGQ